MHPRATSEPQREAATFAAEDVLAERTAPAPNASTAKRGRQCSARTALPRSIEQGILATLAAMASRRAAYCPRRCSAECEMPPREEFRDAFSFLAFPSLASSLPALA